jgi:DNA-binding NtrC family response regulator
MHTVFDLVIADFVMPKVNGLKLVDPLHSAQPKFPIIFITGYLSPNSAKAILDDAAEVLVKPFELDALEVNCSTLALPLIVGLCRHYRRKR